MEKNIRKKVYLKLFYSMLDWEWYTDANTMRVFLHLLLIANRKDNRYCGNVIHRGEALASREYLSNTLKISEQQVRTALKHLKSTGEITVRKIGQTSVIHISKYDDYQSETAQSTEYQQKNNQKETNCKPKDDQSSTTLIYCKNEENVSNDIMKECAKKSHTLGKLNNVILTDDEYDSFKRDYPLIADKIIDELSVKIATGDKRYEKGHFGHLYVFAKHHRHNKTVNDDIKHFDPSYRDLSGINEKILEMSRNLDPSQTKRRSG